MSTPASANRASNARHGGRRLFRSVLGEHLSIPLYREGYALMLNASLTALFGVVYWLLAAHNYSPHVLGLNSAAISAMMFLAGISQLNLMSALVRFVPVAGRGATRFVLSSYLISVCVAVGVVLVFLLGIQIWAPALRFLTSSPGLVLWFTAATMAWCVFTLQDSVLTGLRAAVIVPIENLVYAVVKIVLLVTFVEVSPHYGIFASWTAALVVSLVPVNLLIYGRLLPRHGRGQEVGLPPRRQLARFVSADYIGALFWLGATMLMPVIVTALEGATSNAYFSLAWMIALPLYAVTVSTGASLVVTASRDEARLPDYARRVLMQTIAIVIPVALFLALASSPVLSLFGDNYAVHSSTTLTLLAFSAIPNVVNALFVSVYRVQRRMSRVVMVLGAQCGGALVLGVALLELIGIAGIGLAWLIAQSVTATALLLGDPKALLSSPHGRSLGPASTIGRPVGAIRNRAADLGVLEALVRMRRGPANVRRSREARRLAPEILANVPADRQSEPPARWTQHRIVPTVSDVTVITAGPPKQSPRAIIKLPTTAPARAALGRESDALAALNADPRLRDWCRVLPTALARGEIAGRPYVVQRLLPGIAASQKVANPDRARQVLTAATSAIGVLHHLTSAPAAIDGAILERWVDRPARVVRQVGATLAGHASADAATRRLAEQLHDGLEGRTLPVGWAHGDYVPVNLLTSADGASILGIVDWDMADSAGLPPIDVVALLLSTRTYQRRQEAGYVVREFVSGSSWTGLEQDLLDSASSRLPGEQVDSRTLVLLWWLRHVAGNLTKSTRYARSRLWLRWNVRVVLDVFGLE